MAMYRCGLSGGTEFTLSGFVSQTLKQVGSGNKPTLVSNATVGSKYLLWFGESSWQAAYHSALSKLITGATVNSSAGMWYSVLLLVTATSTTIKCNGNSGLNTNSFYFRYKELE